MQYKYFYRYTDTGIEYVEYKMEFWYHFNVCPECGKKLKSINDIIIPPIHICNDCYCSNSKYKKIVDAEPNLKYHRSHLHQV